MIPYISVVSVVVSFISDFESFFPLRSSWKVVGFKEPLLISWIFFFFRFLFGLNFIYFHTDLYYFLPSTNFGFCFSFFLMQF